MLRIITDSGSSIKKEEKDLYGVEILPLRFQFEGQDFLDGVDLDINEFYERLQKSKDFPKTSLPSLEDTEKLVTAYTEAGDDVLIITISSGISGTCQVFRSLFAENKHVAVVDSKSAVGGVRFLVQEARRNENEPIEVIVDKLNQLIPRIVVAAIPESLDYLLAGGRLSKAGWMAGKLLSIKPVIGLVDGNVCVLSKKRGLKQGMKYIVELLEEMPCDPEFGIIASYTYSTSNLEELNAMLTPEQKTHIKVYDNLTPAIACHWGPNAFGYVYVRAAK